ncbi:MAG: putative DNA binding domain-containing protein [Bifidobacteriaceae bacterium]|jgi:ATP-dependent DNA helicase RecG|nr:putative DNA binding domain-containing protein [Bifidobacteriaceae bacterium]
MMGTVEDALRLAPDEALEVLSSMPEDQWFDRKSGRTQAKDLAVPLVAFGNAEGGYLVVGVHGGMVEGVTSRRANDLRQAAIDFTEPPVKTTVSELTASNGKTALIIRVQPSDHVHTTSRGECYLRIGDESRRLTFAQQRELEFDRGMSSFDARPVQTGLDYLDERLCAGYQRRIGSSSITDMLHARGLLTPDGRVTVAAWLLFADHPGQLFPGAHVRVLKYADRERGAGSRMTLMAGHDIRFDGPLGEQVTQATAQIAEWIPTLSRLGDDGRFHDTPIIPQKAWEEGLVNAVVHRSYSMHGDHIRVEVFPNRIEISNPGRFPGLADLRDPTTIPRFARNPRIARVLAEMGIARELGEGIRRMFGHMRAGGLVDPLYQQSSMGVTLTLFDQPIAAALRDSLPRMALHILSLLQEARKPLGTTQIAAAAGVARPTAIKHLKTLRSGGLVTWNSEGPRDPRATWSLT